MRKTKNYKKNNTYFIVFFIIYLILLIWLLFFQVGSTERESYFKSRSVHIIPFENTYRSIKLAINNDFGTPHKRHFRYITVRNIIGNVALFIPWGFLVPLIFSSFEPLKRLIFFTILTSLCVEIIQFILIVGVADIDDVIFNTLGALAGYYLYCLLKMKR